MSSSLYSENRARVHNFQGSQSHKLMCGLCVGSALGNPSSFENIIAQSNVNEGDSVPPNLFESTLLTKHLLSLRIVAAREGKVELV